ncbi:tripartite tricarboxylate transporter substrate binding protein [Muricoccus radiodurans]|uniref:tripartite tricarboxylate transporter substrate binding protein n=1 Tax=Muricoccus radiodurans TaxID=2231721 RepID=UPI003CE951BA
MITRRMLGGLLALSAPLGRAAAQDGPVTMVVPYTPGTGHDILARAMAPFLGQRLGQPVVVDNRAGASGNIGSQAVSRALPDGRTLMLQGNAFVINPGLFRQVPYDPIGSFTPVATLVRADMALVVHPDVPASDAAGFVALAKSGPALDYASPGIGTPQHMAMALFALRAGFQASHVPYRGSAPAVQDVVGRRVACMFMPVHTAVPLAQNGQVRILATAGAQRAAVAPDVPTLIESGFPAVDVDLWYAVLGPAGMAQPLVARLNAEINAWLADPGAEQLFRAQGMVPAPGTPQALAELIAGDVRRWAEVIRAGNISAD